MYYSGRDKVRQVNDKIFSHHPERQEKMNSSKDVKDVCAKPFISDIRSGGTNEKNSFIRVISTIFINFEAWYNNIHT